MERELLLTKSNFQKNKGSSIGLFFLIFISAVLIGAALLLFFDAYPTARKEAARLEAGDSYLWIRENVEGITDEDIEKLLKEEVSDYYSYHCLGYSNVSLPFGDGMVAPGLLIYNTDAFQKKLDRTEVVVSDDGITEDYLYLPYQFYTSGGYRIGEPYSFELSGTTYTFIIKGFTNTTNWGCSNCGIYEFVLDDVSYEKLWQKEKAADSILISMKLKEGVRASGFNLKIENEILKLNGASIVEGQVLEDVLAGKSFMSLIIAVCFLVITMILIMVVTMMLISCISNYIRENLKIVGALKAIGYTSHNIRLALYIQFGMLAMIGSLLGIGCAYALMPAVSKLVIAQMGVPYTVSFHMGITICPIIGLVLFVIGITGASTRKIKTIEPVVALREGQTAHNFKKNHVRLDRSVLGLQVSLALKTMCTNVKQNMITFFVTGLLIFSCIISLMLYENFSRNPKLELLSFELCSGAVATDAETADAVYSDLEKRGDVTNIREICNIRLQYKEEDRLLAYIFDDVSKMNNVEVCYQGRLPEYDNEIAVSGKFCEEYGYEVGDELELQYGGRSYRYLITGLVQTCNNSGKEAVFSKQAAEHIIDFTGRPVYYWFDCAGADEVSTQEILDECIDKYGDHIVATINFYKTIEGSMTIFRKVAGMMLVLVVIISVIVTAVVLYLLMKTLLYNKRKDYGIYKALGYTSGNLILQTALSFMPAITLSVIVFSILSYYTANPYMRIFMGTFGLMKCNFAIPVGGTVMIGFGMVLFAFLIAILLAGRIRKLEAYDMLTQE